MVRFGLDMIRLVKHDLAGVVKTCTLYGYACEVYGKTCDGLTGSGYV